MVKSSKRIVRKKTARKSVKPSAQNVSRLQQGLAVMKKIGWGTNEMVHEMDEDLWTMVVENNFGAVWSRAGLSLRDREMICIATLVALGANGVGAHFRKAHAVGLSEGEMKEIILQVMPYAGLPKTLHAMNIFKKVVRGEPTGL